MSKLKTGYIIFAVLLALVLLATQSIAIALGFAFLFGTPLYFMNPLPAYATSKNLCVQIYILGVVHVHIRVLDHTYIDHHPALI